MSHIELARIIDDAFERRESIGPATTGECAGPLKPRSICSTAARRGWHRNQALAIGR